MKQLVTIEYSGQRVLTTAQLAEAFGTAVQIITNNFNRNRARYTEGKHYYGLTGEQKHEFLNQNQIDLGSKKATVIYLWTEKGAWLHAKSLNTDQAWEAYEMLVDDYYHVKQVSLPPMSPAEILAGVAKQLVEQERRLSDHEARIVSVDKDIKSIRDVVALNITNWRNDTADLIKRTAQAMGGYEHIKHLREESYRLLDERLGVSLGTRLTNKRRRMADEGVCKSKRDKLNYLDVIAEDKKLIEGYVAIVKDIAIKHGAKLGDIA